LLSFIREKVEELIKKLSAVQLEYNNLDIDGQYKLFYEIRKRYNDTKLIGNCDVDKAVDFIFLNRTCFNGLYRVNRKGQFNVPFGKYKNTKICDYTNLFEISNLLKNVIILNGEYNQCREYANDKTFVYFDPPYRPLTPTQSFVSYSKDGFGDKQQIELAKFSEYLVKSGCKVLLSNSDPKNINPNDNFFDDLYVGFNICRVNAKRIINCKACKRGSITEIIVYNYVNEIIKNENIYRLAISI